MKKDIKDYLHLYIGSECIAKYSLDREEKRTTINAPLLHELTNETKYCKPILRPLSDMTEAEMQRVAFLGDAGGGLFEIEDFFLTRMQKYIGHHLVWTYLLKQGFDLFDLIPEGLAIDKTKMK